MAYLSVIIQLIKPKHMRRLLIFFFFFYPSSLPPNQLLNWQKKPAGLPNMMDFSPFGGMPQMEKSGCW